MVIPWIFVVIQEGARVDVMAKNKAKSDECGKDEPKKRMSRKAFDTQLRAVQQFHGR